MSDEAISRPRRRQPTYREHQQAMRRKNLVTALSFGGGAAFVLVLILLA